jgi:hypothetical protein
METLILCYRGEYLREFALGGRALEVGSGAGCDIVVHDLEGVEERHLLVQAKGGTVLVHDLAGQERKVRSLPPNEPLPVGHYHTLVRIPDVATRPRPLPGSTEPISIEPVLYGGGLTLVVGPADRARRVPLDGRPFTIGTAQDCDLSIDDRAVSARHCRIEPAEDGLSVRDLGSRNGTHVDGVPVALARVGAGSTIRIGRTDLRLVPQSSHAEIAGMIARSPAMREVLSRAQRFARLRWPVLVTGESGTGKEGVARALHVLGPRANGPFIEVNAGGMPASLIESELFGHERGSFTGAAAQHRGMFEQADGGTLLLDEIGELPLEMQSRLLRVLETWEVRRVGGEKPITVDVRLVCATHRDLSAMVAEGRFRQDLYYRIAQLSIDVAPLRERPEDVAALAEHFLARAIEDVGPRQLSRAALAALVAHPWLGNARELRNLIQRAAASCAGTMIEVTDLGIPDLAPAPTAAQLDRVLDLHRGNVSAAAKALGVPRTTFRDRMKNQRR